jgi:hypothetical protein
MCIFISMYLTKNCVKKQSLNQEKLNQIFKINWYCIGIGIVLVLVI